MRKRVCKHNFEECLITYHYKTIVGHERFEITRHEQYCTKCGKIDHKRFDGDLVKKKITNTDRFTLSMISKDELIEKYPTLPLFNIEEDRIKEDKVDVTQKIG